MYYDSRKEFVQKYLSEISRKSLFVFGRNKELLNAILGYLNDGSYTYGERNRRYSELYHLLWTKDTKHLADIFSGSEYKVIVILLGKEWAEKFKKIWDRSTAYIYSAGVSRRSFRTQTYDFLYLSSAIDKLKAMFYLAAEGFTFAKYFSCMDTHYFYNTVIPDLLALEIDENNETVQQQIKDIVYGDNNTGLITREIIKGILMSHNQDAHKWAGELLLAAKLQEGLRQTIVECMDEGSKEGFLYILKIILDNDLVRFSSVVRALDVWTGLGLAAQKPAVVKKCLETAFRCLTADGYSDECLGSSDVLLIYMGLWARAFADIGLAESNLKSLLASSKKYQRLTALYFLRQAQFALFQHLLALPLLDDPDYEVKCWVLENLFSDANYISLRPDHRRILLKYKNTEGISLEEQFARLQNILENMPGKEIVFKESVFPWCQAALTSDQVLVKMLLILALEKSESRVDLILDYRDKMSPETRWELVNNFLSDPQTGKQKTALVEFMGDKSSQVRTCASKIIEKLELSRDDNKIIEDLLHYKSGDLRKNAITVLLRQSPEGLLESIQNLLAEKNENKILAALDMISAIEKEPKFTVITAECRNMAAAISGQSQKTEVLAKKITNQDLPDFSLTQGLGLYNPKQDISLLPPVCSPGFSTRNIFSLSITVLVKILKTFNEFFYMNKDYEYETQNWNGSFEKVVMGGEHFLRPLGNRAAGAGRTVPNTLDNYPLAEVWRGLARENNLTTSNLLQILFFDVTKHNYFTKKQAWYDALLAELFQLKPQEFDEVLKTLPYAHHILTIFRVLLNEYPKPEVFSICRDISANIYAKTPPERFTEDYVKKDQQTNIYGGSPSYPVDSNEVSFWLRYMKTSVYDEHSFREFFQTGYAFYKASGFKSHACLELADFEKAFSLGLVDENELYAELCGRPLSGDNLRILTNRESRTYKEIANYTKLQEVCAKVVERTVSIELQRGDMTTEVSRLAAKIYYCQGTRFFVEILVGAEKDTYVRGYNFVGFDSTKKEIFSHLLKYCYPAEGEDHNTLGELLKERRVTEKQLIDAAMYAPQWLNIVEKYLNWPGLKAACWYFHAHVNETFSQDKETIVARYSPISPQDFKNGAFDITWFNEAYTTLGDKRFQLVYDSAKYIAGGGQHKRSQLFADAVLDKIDLKAAEKVISEKRNKDYVLCYGLIPLAADQKDLLPRYEFLHGFLKESKQFGAQRRESEGKAVAISLENLARNAGFSDVSRLTWSMETEKIHSIAQYLKPAPVEDLEIHISIDELGRAELKVSKAGKELKSVPSRLKNHEYVKEIQAARKSLKDQYSRARVTLEKAMETGDMFTGDELNKLSANPVISPLLQNLVFISGTKLGYFRNMVLVNPDNHEAVLRAEDQCYLAHPVHLYTNGVWPAYQKDIYDRKVVQPFKQVFRELYKPNADELETQTISHRYDGQQIQPKKAAALLKGRGWTASYQEGLQKVYYKENIIAQIFAMADWFSPADVEAPSIEGITFADRKTGKPLPIPDIPAIIFSEIMRDVDLVVSVAHVGGVDPEASLSTVEMRTVIIAEMLRLLKPGNVELKGSHAMIKGTLGQYTVHLGSGIVHKMAGGAVNILPVHSQHRGRIFLPFVDDDPKTAEIISKVILLAEDSKIKDPSILVQIADAAN